MGLKEKDLTLKIAQYLKQDLENYKGVEVILTHDGVSFPNDNTRDVAARAMIARNAEADLYVSLHINSSGNNTLTGASVYVTSRTELPKYKEEMTILGNKITDNLNEIGIPKEGVYNNVVCKT